MYGILIIIIIIILITLTIVRLILKVRGELFNN